MKHQITQRYTGAVLFEADIPDDTPSGLVVRTTLEQATNAGAYLVLANLAGANLDGAYLDGANLAGANLAGANLAGANLDGAYLDGAYLAGAYLAGANLAGANLAGANLAGAYLDGANLAGAYLARANLAGANLAGAYLAGAYLAGADLAGERPVFQIGPIGSRAAYLVAYLTDRGVVLKTGCFAGSVESFKYKLQAEHGDDQHAQEYRAALALIEAHAKLWTPKATAQEVEAA